MRVNEVVMDYSEDISDVKNGRIKEDRPHKSMTVQGFVRSRTDLVYLKAVEPEDYQVIMVQKRLVNRLR